MSYDIFGNTLARGHCEVHPYVGEEYPCSLCFVERERYDAMRRENEERRNSYYAQQRGEIEYESWFGKEGA